MLTSNMLPTRVFCCSSSETPLAVLILVFSILRSLIEDMLQVCASGDCLNLLIPDEALNDLWMAV